MIDKTLYFEHWKLDNLIEVMTSTRKIDCQSKFTHINDFSNKTKAGQCSPAGPFCCQKRVSFIILWLWVHSHWSQKFYFCFKHCQIKKSNWLIFDKFQFVPAIIVHNKWHKNSIFLLSSQFCNIRVRKILLGYLSRWQLLAFWLWKF